MSDMAKDDELDRVMARNFGPPHSAPAQAESIEPSSGFAASVMERVREEAASAAAVSPIAFPWLRAVPGICMAVLALAVCITLLVFAGISATHVLSHALFSVTVHAESAPVPSWVEVATRLHLGWLVVALAVAFVPLMLSRSLAGRGHHL